MFWPKLPNNDYFLFPIIGTDINGNKVTFSMPLLFIGIAPNSNLEIVNDIRDAYNAEGIRTQRLADTGNAKVCFAERALDLTPDADPKGDPQMPAKTILFDTGNVNGRDFDINGVQPNFYPEIQTATVGISAVQKLLQKDDAFVEMMYAKEYRDAKFDKVTNRAEVFFRIADPKPAG